MSTLVVVDTAEYAGRDLSVEAQVLGTEVTIKRFTYTADEHALINACEGAECILTDYTPFSASVINQLGSCRLISVSATGFGCIDVAAAAENGISVCAIDEYCTQEVADHTLLLILSLARKLRTYDRQVQQDLVWQFDTTTGLLRLDSLTLGLVGFGRIGQAVAKRAAGFGMNVIAHDPYTEESVAKGLNTKLCDLETVLATSDIISLHCAATEDNRHLIGQDAFDLMAKTPILINVARGSLVDETALVEALDSGKVSAAGLDVLESESPNLNESKLLGRENVLLTPHVAFYSDAAMLDSRTVSAANIRHFMDGAHEKVRKYIHHANQD